MSEAGLTDGEVVELLAERDGAPDAPPVGFVGLGQIGAPMASHLVDWPGGLTVFDVRADACDPLVAGGARRAGSVSELAAGCDVVSVMVRDDPQVWEVLQEVLLSARPGTVVAVHSTIGLDTAVALAEAAALRGVEVVDAPVSGGFMGAHAGNLAVMVGGDPEAVERCRPPFETWAALVSHLGPVGAGTRAKLARNLLHFVAFTAAGEAQRLAEAAGIDLVELGRIIRHTDAVTGGPGAVVIRGDTAPIPVGDGLREVFEHASSLGRKDLRLAVEMGQALDVDVPMARFALENLASALGVPGSDPEPQTEPGES